MFVLEDSIIATTAIPLNRTFLFFGISILINGGTV